MPSVWAHSIFGELVLERLDLGLWLGDDPAAKPLFRLACQGPDPLFYHRFYPWTAKARAASDFWGGLLHRRRCGPFLRELLQRSEGAQPGDPRAIYALGWLTHHALDRIAHPYVFARQGSRKWDHQRLEAAIDTFVLERLRGLDAARTPVAPTLDAGPRLPEAVCASIEDAMRRVYPEHASPFLNGLWHRSYRDTLTAFRLFHDPAGVKRAVTGGAIEPFVPGRRVEPYDAMNERGDPWRPPEEPSGESRETFWDVWERALLDGEQLLGAAAVWLEASRRSLPDERETAWLSFAEALGDRSYETGLAADR